MRAAGWAVLVEESPGACRGPAGHAAVTQDVVNQAQSLLGSQRCGALDAAFLSKPGSEGEIVQTLGNSDLRGKTQSTLEVPKVERVDLALPSGPPRPLCLREEETAPHPGVPRMMGRCSRHPQGSPVIHGKINPEAVCLDWPGVRPKQGSRLAATVTAPKNGSESPLGWLTAWRGAVWERHC